MGLPGSNVTPRNYSNCGKRYFGGFILKMNIEFGPKNEILFNFSCQKGTKLLTNFVHKVCCAVLNKLNFDFSCPYCWVLDETREIPKVLCCDKHLSCVHKAESELNAIDTVAGVNHQHTLCCPHNSKMEKAHFLSVVWSF